MLLQINHPRTWDTDDRTLQSFYGLALWDLDPAASKPHFGAAIRLRLRDMSIDTLRQFTSDPQGMLLPDEEQSIKTEEIPPTLVKLAGHFGHLQWVEENVRSLNRKSKGLIQPTDLDNRFYLGAQHLAVQEFVMRRVIPLSKAAEKFQQPLYAQCVPLHTLTTEVVTGQTTTTDGERVLCVLPKTPSVAQYYGVSEEEIQLLAPQVLWVVQHHLHTFHSAEQLIEALRGWGTYVNAVHPPIMRHLQKRVETRYPYLLTVESRQALAS